MWNIFSLIEPRLLEFGRKGGSQFAEDSLTSHCEVY